MPYNFGVQYDEINYKLYEYLLFHTFETPKSKIEQIKSTIFYFNSIFLIGMSFYLHIREDRLNQIILLIL